MPARNLLLGLGFLLMGVVTLCFKRMLSEEANKYRWSVFGRKPLPASIGRVIVVIGGIVLLLLGFALLARLIN
jgi:hypothetical protein